MRAPISVKMGDPVYSPDRKEVWAFWNEDRTVDGRFFKIITRPMLLGLEPDLKMREITFTGERWVVSGDTTQHDLANSPFFFTNPLQGPQARLAALKLLLKDPEFCSFFKYSPAIEDSFNAYASYLEKTLK